VLHADVDGAGPRVVLVHGFTQTRRSWGAVADGLARDHEVVRVDLPGHGRSGAVRAGLWETGRLLAEAGGTGAYVGYSLGGRASLHAALAAPDRVRALVLVGATPGIRDGGERARRREADEARAAEVERVGVAAFVASWLSQPMFSGLRAEAAGVEARLENTAEGLASSLRLAGVGCQEPLWDRLGELRVPVLCVAGERDERYAALARETAAAIGPHASAALVPGAGHAAHLERPDEFLAAVRPFLARYA
jgi:2-succinyl-6-hydroxy-2,4-cyclohexadiene-1-carboxylate synthase